MKGFPPRRSDALLAGCAALPVLLLCAGTVSRNALVLALSIWMFLCIAWIALTAATALAAASRRVRLAWVSAAALLIPPAAALFAPAVARDELSHHLAVAELWLERGELRPIAGIVVSYFPGWTEALYSGALALGAEALAKSVHFLIGLCVLAIPLRFLRDGKEAPCGRAVFLLALLWLSTPTFYALLWVAYSDFGALAALLGGTLLWTRWLDEAPPNRIHLAAASLLWGLALAIKYTALPTVAVLGALSVFEILRRRYRGADARAYADLPVLFFAFLLPAPQFIVNFLQTGNPTYPLLHGLWTGERLTTGAALSPLAMRELIFHESLAERLLIPLRVFLTGRFDDPARFDGVLNPLWLAFPLLFRWSKERRPDRIERYLLALWIGISALTLFAASARARYYLPALVPLAALVLRRLPQIEWTKPRRRIGVVLAGAGLLFGFAHNVAALLNQDVFAYLSGKTDLTAYLKARVPEYAAAAAINRSADADATVYPILTGNRFYHLERRVHLDASFLPETIERAAEAAVSPEDMGRRLRAEGITHLLYPPVNLSRTLHADLEPDAFARAAAFLDRACRRIAVEPPFIACEIPRSGTD